jgi:hypothetical protein
MGTEIDVTPSQITPDALKMDFYQIRLAKGANRKQVVHFLHFNHSHLVLL